MTYLSDICEDTFVVVCLSWVLYLRTLSVIGITTVAGILHESDKWVLISMLDSYDKRTRPPTLHSRGRVTNPLVTPGITIEQREADTLALFVRPSALLF